MFRRSALSDARQEYDLEAFGQPRSSLGTQSLCRPFRDELRRLGKTRSQAAIGKFMRRRYGRAVDAGSGMSPFGIDMRVGLWSSVRHAIPKLAPVFTAGARRDLRLPRASDPPPPRTPPPPPEPPPPPQLPRRLLLIRYPPEPAPLHLLGQPAWSRIPRYRRFRLSRSPPFSNLYCPSLAKNPPGFVNRRSS